MPKQLEAHGLSAKDHLLITPRALQLLATGFTREAGVRQLEREVAAVCRSVAMQVAAVRGQARKQQKEQKVAAAAEAGQQEDGNEDDDEVEQGMVPVEQAQQSAQPLAAEAASFARVVVTPEQLEEILGPVRYESEIAARLSVPGVVTGLAWKVGW